MINLRRYNSNFFLFFKPMNSSPIVLLNNMGNKLTPPIKLQYKHHGMASENVHKINLH